MVELVDAPHSKCGSERSARSIRAGGTISHEPKNGPELGYGSCLIGVKCTERASPQTREMTAERLSCWPPESRTGFGHRLTQTSCGTARSPSRSPIPRYAASVASGLSALSFVVIQMSFAASEREDRRRCVLALKISATARMFKLSFSAPTGCGAPPKIRSSRTHNSKMQNIAVNAVERSHAAHDRLWTASNASTRAKRPLLGAV